MTVLAVDMSLRSSGVVILNDDDTLRDFFVLNTTAKDFPYDEHLIIYLRNQIKYTILHNADINKFVIEGLSLNSASSRKDVIAGAYWGIRTLITEEFSHILIGSVPVKSWRNWATTKEEREFYKEICPDFLKNVVFGKLSIDIQDKFLRYIVVNNLSPKAMFDLADAYWLGRYRNYIDEK